MGFLFRIIATAVAIWIVTLLPLDLVVTGGDGGGWWARPVIFLGVAAILVLINMLVKPVVNLLTLPIRLLTLGLFALIVNWAMLWLTSWLTKNLSFGTLEIGGFWKTMFAALLIAIITVLLGGARKTAQKRKAD